MASPELNPQYNELSKGKGSPAHMYVGELTMLDGGDNGQSEFRDRSEVMRGNTRRSHVETTPRRRSCSEVRLGSRLQRTQSEVDARQPR